MGFFTSIRNLLRSGAEPDAAAQETGTGGAPTSAASRLGREGAIPDPEALALALRQAEPRLSGWLAVVLEGVDKADDRLWDRIAFLLGALEASPAEADAFIAKFRLWLDDMEYEHLEDFKSELQYRLALALNLEDEEDVSSGTIFLDFTPQWHSCYCGDDGEPQPSKGDA